MSGSRRIRNWATTRPVRRRPAFLWWSGTRYQEALKLASVLDNRVDTSDGGREHRPDTDYPTRPHHRTLCLRVCSVLALNTSTTWDALARHRWLFLRSMVIFGTGRVYCSIAVTSLSAHSTDQLGKNGVKSSNWSLFAVYHWDHTFFYKKRLGFCHN